MILNIFRKVSLVDRFKLNQKIIAVLKSGNIVVHNYIVILKDYFYSLRN